MELLKYVGYAYPSSIVATKAGKGNTGCYYVSVGERGDFGRYDVPLSYHNDKLTALAEAAKLDFPFYMYSIKEIEK